MNNLNPRHTHTHTHIAIPLFSFSLSCQAYASSTVLLAQTHRIHYEPLYTRMNCNCSDLSVQFLDFQQVTLCLAHTVIALVYNDHSWT